MRIGIEIAMSFIVKLLNMKSITLRLYMFFCLFLQITISYGQWTILPSGTSKNLQEIQFLNNSQGYVVGEKATVLKTNDGGNSWISCNPSINSDLHNLFFIDNNRGWVVGDSGKVCKTINAGNSWEITTIANNHTLHLHSVFAQDQNTIFVGGSNNTQNYFIYKSIDGGITWQSVFVESYIWNIDILKIVMQSANTGYALTRGIVLKTIDAGSNWFITDTLSVKSGAMFSILEDIAVFPNSDTMYVCGWYPAYLGTSLNEANTWQHQALYDYYNLDFISPSVGYVGGWGYMHKTKDGGKTYQDVSGGNTQLFSGIYSIDFIDENHGFACGERGKIIRTTSGGTTGISTSVNSTSFIYPNPSTGFVSFDKYYDVSIYNSLGQFLQKEENINSIQIGHLCNGIYQVHLKIPGTNDVILQRLVKQ